MSAETLPLSRRLNRWKIRMRRRVDNVLAAVLVAVLVPVVLALVLLQSLGLEIFDENGACECCNDDDSVTASRACG